MSLIELGKKSAQSRGTRDACHVPCIAVECISPLEPGQKVKFTNELGLMVRPHNAMDTEYDAIVDPFLPRMTEADHVSLYWVLLRPGTVKQLTHHFHVDGLKSKEDQLREELDAALAAGDDDDDGCRGCW